MTYILLKSFNCDRLFVWWNWWNRFPLFFSNKIHILAAKWVSLHVLMMEHFLFTENCMLWNMYDNLKSAYTELAISSICNLVLHPNATFIIWERQGAFLCSEKNNIRVLKREAFPWPEYNENWTQYSHIKKMKQLLIENVFGLKE